MRTFTKRSRFWWKRLGCRDDSSAGPVRVPVDGGCLLHASCPGIWLEFSGNVFYDPLRQSRKKQGAFFHANVAQW